MNTRNTIEQLDSILIASTQCPKAKHESMARAEKMYQTTFRTLPFKLSTIDDWEDTAELIKTDIIEALYTKSTGIHRPAKPSLNEHHAKNCNYEQAMELFTENAINWASEQNTNIEINSDTLVVDILNYKGEFSNRITLHSQSKEIPVFTSKADSFLKANS